MTRTFIYFVTIVVGQLTSLLLLPVITKFLSPQAFGEYALALATTGLIGTFGSAWVRNVGMRLFFDYAAVGRTRAFFWTAALLQAAIMLVCLAAGYLVIGGTSQALPLPVYASAGLSVMAADFYAFSLNTLRAGQRAVSFGIAEIVGSAVRLGGTWLGLLAGFQTPAMLFIFATLSAAAAALAAAPELKRVLSGPPSIQWRAMGELVRLGLPSIPLSLGGWIIAMSDRTLLAYFLDLRAVGVYSAAYSLADRAVSGLMSAVFMTAWPAILGTWSADREAVPRTISRYLAAFALVSAGPSVLLVAQGEFVLTLLTTPEYASAAIVVPYVVAGAWLSGVSTYLNRPLELVKRYGTLSAITMAAAAINLGLNVWLIPLYGLRAAAFSTMCAFGAMAVLSGIFGRRILRVPIPIGSLLLAGGAAALAEFVSRWASHPFAAIAVFLVTYYGMIAVAFMQKRGWLRVASAKYPGRPQS